MQLTLTKAAVGLHLLHVTTAELQLLLQQLLCPCSAQVQLHTAGIKVRRIVQAPGEFVITFPRAYHGGFSNGFCVGEAVNFSIGDWFPFGLEAAQRYRRLSRLPVLAHDELLCLEGLAIHGVSTLPFAHLHLLSINVCASKQVCTMRCTASNRDASDRVVCSHPVSS